MAACAASSCIWQLFFHQVHSGPVIEELQKWFTKQLVDKLVESNSGLIAAEFAPCFGLKKVLTVRAVIK
jgi:hypothetical protein